MTHHRLSLKSPLHYSKSLHEPRHPAIPHRSLLLSLTLLIASPVLLANGLPTADPESVGMSAERLQRLPDAMQRFIDADKLAGTVTLVARDGQVVHLESRGMLDRESGEPMQEDSIFFIMSMTKPVVSVALMMLYEEGHFLLTDPISDWIPELADKKVLVNDRSGSRRVPAAGPVTFRHVLSHTAGLDPDRSLLNEDEQALLAREDSLEATIVKRAPLPLAFHPGEQWQYGSATDYVALLVERISGQPLREFLAERIFAPLQMQDTSYAVPRDKLHRVASVYSPSGPQQTIELSRHGDYAEQPFFGSDYYGGTAGLFSTAPDYWRFSQMLLNGGELDGQRLLSPTTLNLMISNHTGDKDIYVRGPGWSFGLGFGIVSDVGQARDPASPGTFSWGGAWGTIFFADPVENLVGIMMTQITSYNHLNARQVVPVTVLQAVTESHGSLQAYPVLD